MSGKQEKEQMAQMRGRPDEEIAVQLRDKVEEYRKYRFKHALGQLPGGHVLGNTRRHIARLQTVLSERRRSSEERT